MRTIVVTGTHAVGKTVLCEHLAQVFSSTLEIKIIPEMARILMARGISLNDRADEFGIVSYVAEYLKYVRETKAQLVISDRSVFDLFAYINVSRSDSVRNEFLRLVEEVVFQEVRRVDVYVYVPIEFKMQLDDVRPADVQYQLAVDLKVRELLTRLGARVLTVSGSVEERVATVKAWLDA